MQGAAKKVTGEVEQVVAKQVETEAAWEAGMEVETGLVAEREAGTEFDICLQSPYQDRYSNTGGNAKMLSGPASDSLHTLRNLHHADQATALAPSVCIRQPKADDQMR